MIKFREKNNNVNKLIDLIYKILNDLYKVRTQLHYYDTIFRVNTNQKLKVHNEIRAKLDVYKWE